MSNLPTPVESNVSPRAAESRLTRGALQTLISGTSIGQIIEWFDWSVYAIFAPYFAQQFFPSSSPLAALLATYVVFGVAFVVRPIGGIAFGYVADRAGRRPAFTASILLMAAGMATISVIPTYATIGLAAPVLLSVARLAQGLSAGGEMPAASAYLTESAPPQRRGFYSSFIWLGVGAGTLLAMLAGMGLTLLFSPDQLADWGWRIPFGLGALFCLYGLRLRRTLPETEAYRREHNRQIPGPRPGLRVLIRAHPGGVLRAIGFSVGGTVAFYTLAAYLPGALRASVGISASTAFAITAIALVVFIVQMPLWGHLADRFGRRPIMATGAFGIALMMAPVANAMSGTTTEVILVLCIAMTFGAMASAPASAVLAEQFPTSVRALGIGLPYSLATSVFGGTAPYLAAWLDGHGLRAAYFGWVALLCVITGLTFLTMREMAGKELP